MPKSTIYAVMTCLAYASLVGCGTKGPLYIPEQRYPQSVEHKNHQFDAKQHATGFEHSSAGLQANIHAPSGPALEAL